jgi:hypothetical protein
MTYDINVRKHTSFQQYLYLTRHGLPQPLLVCQCRKTLWHPLRHRGNNSVVPSTFSSIFFVPEKHTPESQNHIGILFVGPFTEGRVLGVLRSPQDLELIEVSRRKLLELGSVEEFGDTVCFGGTVRKSSLDAGHHTDKGTYRYVTGVRKRTISSSKQG